MSNDVSSKVKVLQVEKIFIKKTELKIKKIILKIVDREERERERES